MVKLIIDTSAVRLWHHEEDGIVHHEWLSSIAGKDFRDALMVGADLMKTPGTDKWMSDDRNHVLLKEDDEEWAKTVWFPRTKRAGWKFWAIVKPEASLGALNMSRFVRFYADLGITATMVGDLDTALGWLRAWGKSAGS